LLAILFHLKLVI